MEALEGMCNPPHPGAVLRDGCLGSEPMEAAARRLGVGAATLAQVLVGRGRITPALALKLEAGGWPKASSLMRMQAAYDLAQERLRQEKEAA